MLHDLLVSERSAILTRCEEKVVKFGGTLAAKVSSAGWSLFYDEFVELLLSGDSFKFIAEHGGRIDAPHKGAKDYVRLGYTISEVVRSYGIVSQSITDCAKELDYQLDPLEISKLNLSLDVAISTVVDDYDRVKTEEQDIRVAERLGVLAHELRNNLQSATVAFEVIEGGQIGAGSNTSIALHNSLQRMGNLINTALTEVRIHVEPIVQLERVPIVEILNEVGITAGFQARIRNITLRMQGYSDLEVLVDRQLIISAVSNLVQNALKYTHEGGTVEVRALKSVDRVLIEVADACGGLNQDSMQELFKPFTQNSSDRSGVGLGLSITKRAVIRCNGTLRVANLPGKGCIFTIDLPEVPPTIPLQKPVVPASWP